ncbi:ABC transporter substrate-binding protein [Labedella endophytica]|uniref:Peptide ABC transporter substrate-binding protein n=1 Tax=Labedella endophytica TaxID=1523160 RepID=A0A3S0WZB7_9MICO|nr:ABC transporter substrate-binding protein [Labedella endophytica]RUR01806.1 peptide ABC transporter substrate-binding protein [Labedella endophytica]
MVRRRKAAATIAAAAALSLAFAGCSTGSDSAEGGEQTLTLASAVDINSFAPADSRDAHYVQYYQPVYDTLIQIAPDGEYVADLATEWEWNDDQTTLSLTLRDDVVFTDGSDFDADAVKANIEATREGTGTSSVAFAAISDIVVNSATSVDLVFTQPDPGIIRQLALPGGAMASPDSIDAGTLADAPVGTGPYVLDEAETTKTVQYTFVRNDDYWNAEAYPYDRIVIKPITDATARFNAVRSGEVDGATGDAINAEQAEGAGLTVTTSPGPGFQGLFLFDRDGTMVPALADERVRQALNYAIDREAILDTLYDGSGTITNQVFNPKSEPYDESLEGAYEYDPDRAQELLAEAGYADGFSMTIPEPVYANLSPLLTEQLGAVGITVDWAQVPQAQTNDEYLSGKYAAVWYQLQSSDPWQGINFWGASDAPWNPLGNTDPEIQAAVDLIRTTSGDAQVEAYRALDTLFVEKAWFVPAYFPDAVYFSTAGVDVDAQALQIVPSIANYAPAS